MTPELNSPNEEEQNESKTIKEQATHALDLATFNNIPHLVNETAGRIILDSLHGLLSTDDSSKDFLTTLATYDITNLVYRGLTIKNAKLLFFATRFAAIFTHETVKQLLETTTPDDSNYTQFKQLSLTVIKNLTGSAVAISDFVHTFPNYLVSWVIKKTTETLKVDYDWAKSQACNLFKTTKTNLDANKSSIFYSSGSAASSTESPAPVTNNESDDSTSEEKLSEPIALSDLHRLIKNLNQELGDYLDSRSTKISRLAFKSTFYKATSFIKCPSPNICRLSRLSGLAGTFLVAPNPKKLVANQLHETLTSNSTSAHFEEKIAESLNDLIRNPSILNVAWAINQLIKAITPSYYRNDNDDHSFYSFH